MPGTAKFLHLTDLHISAPELADAHLKSDTSATLRKVRGMIDAMAQAPDFVLVSGDLTNHGDVASFRVLRDMMADLKMPVLYALGNHDSRAGFHQGLLGRNDNLAAPYDHDSLVGNVHVIVLDSSVPARIGGDLDDSQFAFLDAALSRHGQAPKLLMIHHAPALDRDPDWEWEGLSFAATDRLAEMLIERPVAGIFSGHIHQDRFTHWHGMPLVVGMGLHAALDPMFDGPGIRSVAGVSFNLCQLRPSGLSVTCVPLPSDRHEVGHATLEDLHSYEAQLRESA